MRTEYEKATEEVESTVSEETRQETDIPALEQCPGVKAGLWTERMLAALGKGGKWHKYDGQNLCGANLTDRLATGEK